MKPVSRLLQITAFLPALLLAGKCFAESIVTTIPGSEPSAVDTDPITRRVYVASFFTPTIQVISEETNTVVDTITFPPGPDGQLPEFDGVAVNPVTSRLYASDPRAGLVYVVDIRNGNQILTNIPVPAANGIAVNPRTNKIYVSALFPSTVTIIDGKTNTVSNTISVPLALKATVDIFNNRVYVPSQNFIGQVFVLDGKTDAILAQIQTGNFTTSVGIDFLRHLAYASNQGFTPDTDTLSIIDTNTNTVIGTIPTDPSPGPVAVNPFTNRIYVATSFQPQDGVDIIDGNTRQIINRLPVEPSPSDSAIDLVHHRLYIASPNFLLDVPGGNVTTVIDTRP
jgi:DNA-binding beta-propeller fold protein YncE